MVPGHMSGWAEDLLAAAELAPGERVLDVACGTGIVARSAAPRVGREGRVIGLDLTEDMLAVARARPAPAGVAIEWRQGDAAALPFPDGSCDLVCCQQGLQFMPDPRAALREMRRVLAPEGRVAVSVWSWMAGQEACGPVLARFLGAELAAREQAALALADGPALKALLAAAGFRRLDLRTPRRVGRFSGADAYLEYLLSGPLGAAISQLDPESQAALRAEMQRALQPYQVGDELLLPFEAHVAIGRA